MEVRPVFPFPSAFPSSPAPSRLLLPLPQDLNTPEYLNKLKRSIFEQMRDQDFAPSVQINCSFRPSLVFLLL